LLFARFLGTCNLTLTIIFAVEMSLRILGSGCQPYWRKGFNIFDGLVVILSLLELSIGGA
jgi:hypothetical protein